MFDWKSIPSWAFIFFCRGRVFSAVSREVLCNETNLRLLSRQRVCSTQRFSNVLSGRCTIVLNRTAFGHRMSLLRSPFAIMRGFQQGLPDISHFHIMNMRLLAMVKTSLCRLPLFFVQTKQTNIFHLLQNSYHSDYCIATIEELSNKCNEANFYNYLQTVFILMNGLQTNISL